MTRTLVAGLGNIFCSDDGFGSSVAEALAGHEWPEGVELADFGIRGVHLAYQLLDGYDLVVIADTVARGGEPGSLYVIEHNVTSAPATTGAGASVIDVHDLGPDGVLALVPSLGGTLGRVVIVGCEPASMEPGMGLSAPVAASVERAAELVSEIVHDACVHMAGIER